MQRSLSGVLAFCFLAARSFAAITGVVMTNDGAPVAGARVSIRAYETVEASRARLLSATPEAVPIASTQTDSKGVFSLDSPKEPTVELSIYARGYTPVERWIERDEEVGAVALGKSETRKASVSAGGKPVAGANVVINYDSYEYLTKTDAQGRYEAPDPKSARSISVVHPDYAVSHEAFMAMNGVSASSLQRTLVAGSAIAGRVVTGEKNTPVAKATVLVDGWPLATTGDDGAFTIAHMPAKWKTIAARKDSLIGERAMTKEAPLTLRVAKGATVSGRITDTKSRVPIAGATVRIGIQRFGPFVDNASDTLTDGKGAYSLVLPAGTYAVIASHPAYEFRPADVTATAGQQATKDVSLPPLARVSGVVLDESKRPVVVAALDTENVENGRDGPMRFMRGEATASGPDGRFSMRVVADQAFSVRAKKRGLPTAKSESLHLSPGERKTGLVLTIPRGIEVTGRAIDPQGEPLSGVSVTASEVEGGPRGMMFRTMIGGAPGSEEDAVRTASDGTFSMRVKEGTYDFAFKREGLAPKSVRSQHVSVTESPKIEATLEPAVEISGRVTRGGTPLENVFVMAMVPGAIANSTTSAADGSFTISGLAPGSVRLMLRKEEDFVQEQRNVTAPARDVNIDLKAGGRITGRVVEKGSGKPITSFQAGISTSRSGGGMVMMAPPQMRSFTADDGTFTLEAVPAGATVLVANAPGFASGRLNLTVEEGKDLTGVELELDAGVKLTGKVTGPNGASLSDVQVRVVASPTGGFAMRGSEASSTTDANGEYTLEGLEPGEESISFTHPKHSSARKSVTLKGRETRLDVQLEAGGRVTGTVVTESNAPVADAQIEAYSNGGSARARTNANGVFELESVTPGRYHFTASKAGLADGMLSDVDVSSGAPVRIVMKTGGTIYGRITGLTAAELAQTQVIADAGESTNDGAVDNGGNYRIEGVPSGTVRVQASTGTMMAGAMRRAPAQTVELAAGATQQVDIAFRSDVVVRGRVTRNGVPVASGMVTFNSRGSSARGSGTSPTDNDGMYSVSGLDDGDYNVMVMDEKRMSPYTTSYQVHGSDTYDIDYKTASLRGRALDLGNNEPLANVTIQFRPVTAADTPRMIRGAITDSTGAFILDSVPPGNYVATATKDGYGNDVKDVYVGDSTPADLEFHLGGNDGVLLNVIDARDNRPIGARAIAFDMQGRVADQTRMSFGGGETPAIKLSLSPGAYTASVWAGGYAPRTISVQSPSTLTVALSPGGTVQVRSKHTEALRVRLVDSNGQVYPRISDYPSSRELVPSPGATTLQNIAAGVYTLQLLDHEVVIDSKQIVVREGQTTNEEI